MRYSSTVYKIGILALLAFSLWTIFALEFKALPLIPKNQQVLDIKVYNKVFLALSYSLLAALIFYFFTFFIPRKVQIIRAKKIVSSQVHFLLYDLFLVINQTLHTYGIKIELDKVEDKDLISINGEIKEYKGFYRTSEQKKRLGKIGKQFTGFAHMNYSFPNCLIQSLKNIPLKVKAIREANPNFHVDDSFSEVLAAIETNNLIRFYTKDETKPFTYGDSSKHLHKLIYDFNRLKKLNYHTHFRNSHQIIHFYSPEEIENIDKDRRRYLNESQQYFERKSRLNPYILYNPNYQDSKPLLLTLKIKNSIKLSKGSEISIPENSQCAVIISDRISKKCMRKFIRKNNDKLIIILKLSFLQRELTTHKELKNGVHIVHYKGELSFLGFRFSKKYPCESTRNRTANHIHTIIKNRVI